jgi:hypothetical protein
MKISGQQLRMIIREALIEQVVGYKAPDEGSEESSDGGGYLGVGDMGVDTEMGSEEETQASGQQVRSLTKQRQKQLDKGDAVSADETGEQLSLGRRMRG